MDHEIDEVDVESFCDEIEKIIFETRKYTPDVTTLHIPSDSIEDLVIDEIEAELSRRLYDCFYTDDVNGKTLVINIAFAGMN
jgi:hypothetical protein